VNTDNPTDHQGENPLIETLRQAHDFAAGDIESPQARRNDRDPSAVDAVENGLTARKTLRHR